MIRAILSDKSRQNSFEFKRHGCGKLALTFLGQGVLFYPEGKLIPVEPELLAKNDGLSLEDWIEWFKSYDLSEPMAVIHFTSFRYKE